MFKEPVPTSYDLNSIYFFDDNTGWIAGEKGTILKTTDGGTTFAQQYITSDNLNSIFFIDVNTGWISANAGKIFKTTNGGTNWFALNSGTLENLNSARFISLNIGWTAGNDGIILKTTDSGNTWNPQSSFFNGTLKSIFCTGELYCYAAGSGGNIIFTSDGGQTWLAQASGTVSNLNSIHFIDQSTGYIAGDGGIVLKTTNGGLNWNPLSQFTTMALTSIFFKAENIGATVSSSFVYSTTNGGQNWTSGGIPVFNTFKCVFYSNTIEWTAGFNGQVQKSTNNGISWTFLSTQQYSFYCSYSIPTVMFSSATVGYLLKSTGGRLGCDQTEVFRTTNGGVTWTLLNSFSNEIGSSLYGVGTNYLICGYNGFFASNGVIANTGVSNLLYGITSQYVCGSQGIILRYSGIGSNVTFENVTTGTSNNLYNITTTNSGIFSVGAGGIMLKSTNFGTNWYNVSTGTTQDLYGIRIGSGRGYCVGNNGTILKTTDGGENWLSLNSGFTNNLRAVAFPVSNSAATAYITGMQGIILKTTNEGLTWSSEFVDNADMVSISFPSSSTGFISGSVNSIALLLNNSNLNSTAKNLNLKLLVEGFYNEITNEMISDTAKVYLRNSSSPFAIADSVSGIVSQDGEMNITFQNAASTGYYIQVKHRNSIETWSSAPVSFNASSIAYDFTMNSSQAFGNNVKLKGTKWTVYSGDVNNDGLVELTDLIDIYNDALINKMGYILTDLNGDNFADLTDMIICVNNTAAFVQVIRP